MNKEDFLLIESEVTALFPASVKPAVSQTYHCLENGEIGVRYFTKFIRRALFNHTDKTFSDIRELKERKQYYNKNYGEDYYENKIQHTDFIGQRSKVQ